MNTPRSTALAERILVVGAILILVWFLGYDMGKAQAPKIAPVVPCLKCESLTKAQVRNIVYRTAKECQI